MTLFYITLLIDESDQGTLEIDNHGQYLYNGRVDLGILDLCTISKDIWRIVESELERTMTKFAAPKFEILMGFFWRSSSENDFVQYLEKEDIDEKIRNVGRRIYGRMQETMIKEIDKYIQSMKNGYIKSCRNNNNGCGEDNALPALLDFLLQIGEKPEYRITSMSVSTSESGELVERPFCENCSRKVAFYSLYHGLLQGMGYESTESVPGDVNRVLEKLRKGSLLLFSDDTAKNCTEEEKEIFSNAKRSDTPPKLIDSGKAFMSKHSVFDSVPVI